MGSYKKPSKILCVEKRLLKSKAYRSLRTPTAYFVFGIFLVKRQMSHVGRSGKKQWEITNNGEITFTYKEAKAKFGISYGAFRNAIDELLEKGFIDIAESGAGLYKSANLYTISARWKLYGTPEYQKPKQRQKGPINRGFQTGNQYGRNCKKGKKTTVAGQHSSTVADQHSTDKITDSHVNELT